MKRRGFTVLEVLIMSVVALFLLGIVYSIFSQSTNEATKMSRKLQSLQAAHLLLERLESDLKQAYYQKGKYHLSISNHRKGKANRLTFHRAEAATVPPTKESATNLKKLVYAYDPKSAKVTINGKDFGAGRFKRVRFEYNWSYPGDHLTVTVTGVPDELAKTSIEKIDPRQMATVVATIAFRNRAMQRSYATWARRASLVK